MSEDCLLLMCACPGDTVAAEIATALIEQNLAACVNQMPGVKSWYRWQGHFEKNEEVLLLIKTTHNCLTELEAMVQRLHPYEVPELIALPIAAGSAAYLQWIRNSVQT